MHNKYFQHSSPLSLSPLSGALTPTNLKAIQSGHGPGQVEVSWNELHTPSKGYRITVDSTDFSRNGKPDQVGASPHTFTQQLQHGEHSIRLVAHSQHMCSNIVGPVKVTVRGEEIYT